MSEPISNRGVRSGLGRREILGVALGAAAGALAGDAAAGQAGASSYREHLETPIVGRYQVVVAGGGPSGVIAAAAAARSGASTLLIERFPFLGGNGTAGLMTCYNGFRNQRPPEALQTVKGIPAEYMAELVSLDGIAEDDPYPKAKRDVATGDLPYCIGFDPEAAKIASLNLLRKEGVTLRLHSWVVGPMLDGSRVTGVVVESKSGRQGIAADVVIDATGDGDIAAGAGAAFMSPANQGDRMGMSLMYALAGLPADAREMQGGIRIQDRVVKWGPGFGGDGLDVENLTRAEVETRLKLWDQPRNLRIAATASANLAETATCIGFRETRRILANTRSPNRTRSRHAIPGRGGDQLQPNAEQRENAFLRTRSSTSPIGRSFRGVEGLVLTGRCISASRGRSSPRVRWRPRWR